MSRLWRDELRVALCPGRLIVARRSGLRRAIVEGSVDAFPSESAAAPWAGAVAAFRDSCRSAKARNCRVTAILSSHFVRYALLPWKPALRGAADWRAYAEHLLTKTYGAAAAGWQVSVRPTGGREQWLACAADRALIQTVTDAARLSGARLVSIQPALAAAFNRVRRIIKERTAWLVVQETGWLTLALVSDGVWRLVRGRPIDTGWSAELGEILDRESVIAGLTRPIEPLYLLSEEALAAGGGSALSPYRVADVTLPPAAPLDLRACALALQ